jgi:E3 ubiquitin-protein ligase FANCL
VYLSISDKKGRVHIMEIQLDKTYPQKTPSVSAVGPNNLFAI